MKLAKNEVIVDLPEAKMQEKGIFLAILPSNVHYQMLRLAKLITNCLQPSLSTTTELNKISNNFKLKHLRNS
jgi:hypothetical protein